MLARDDRECCCERLVLLEGGGRSSGKDLVCPRHGGVLGAPKSPLVALVGCGRLLPGEWYQLREAVSRDSVAHTGSQQRGLRPRAVRRTEHIALVEFHL